MGQPSLAAAAFQAALFASALLAQPPAQPTPEWIRSPKPLKQAWGAHAIAGQKLEAWAPDLLRILESPDASTGADAARFAALDALIQLKADVPAIDLQPLVDRFPTDVLILASRSHEDASGVLLKLLDRQHNREAFVAVGDLLTPKRDAGFAKAALREFCQAGTVYVYNSDQSQDMGSGWSGDTIGKTDTPRADWPDAGSYRIYPGTGNRRQAWTLLADGAHPVSFVRTANKGYTDHGFDPSGEGSNDNSCLRAEEFLALYLETTPSHLPIHSSAELKLTWTTPEAFEAAVRAFIAEQRARFGVLAGQLAIFGYLPANEVSGMRLNLRIHADDVRRHDRTPLPNINEWAK